MNDGKKRRARKIRRGTVIGNRMSKTITVAVERKFRHPQYKKVIRKISTFKVHDEVNQAHKGDLV